MQNMHQRLWYRLVYDRDLYFDSIANLYCLRRWNVPRHDWSSNCLQNMSFNLQHRPVRQRELYSHHHAVLRRVWGR